MTPSQNFFDNMNAYQMCSTSILDNIADPDITFDKNGVCNYYYEYQSKIKQRLYSETPHVLENIINKISETQKNQEYDCIIGVSGGVDSTYVAYRTKKLGLRPLAVHFDNGWNSELAVKNIENTLKILNIDLYTHVIDWEVFKSIQCAFLRASTPDGEIPTDHAITALLYNVAASKNIKYIISGGNLATEAIMPPTWSYGHIDWTYIETINKLFGTQRNLKVYPRLPLSRYLYLSLKGIKNISILNYLKYDKKEAMNVLQSELNWKYYGGKHYESIYTRFFQGYILPEKFKIDKRKAHLSNLIFSGQLTREEALSEIQKPVYPEELLEEDKTYVIKKLGLTNKEFQGIMTLEPKTYRDYPNNAQFLNRSKVILNRLRQRGIMYS